MMALGTPTTKKVKPKPLREVLGRVLQQLQRRDQYLFFAQPVSAAEVPDYHQFIKQPMDLGTMQKKLEAGEYTSLDSFKEDMLLVTGNAQYFNSPHGPSAIIHTEAKKLEEWGLKAVAKEAPAVEEAMAIAVAEQAAAKQRQQQATPSTPSPSPLHRSNGRINIKIKKGPSFNGSGPGTPRLMTPSRLQHEIKPEDATPKLTSGSDDDSDEQEDGADSEEDDDEDEDDDDEEDDDDDEEDEDDDASTTGRGASMSLDGTGTPRSRDSPDVVKKRRRSGRSRHRPGSKRKLQQRKSAIAALLTQHDSDGLPLRAPISSTSGAVASQIPLIYRSDGAIDLDALNEDEQHSLLRPAGIDVWPDVLAPFLQSIACLHPDLLPITSSLARDVKDTIDGFGAVLAPTAQSMHVTHSYNLQDRPSEQQRLPFSVSSGWAFEGPTPSIPIAWPRLTQTSTAAEREKEREKEKEKGREKERKEEGAQPTSNRAPRKDRERERDEDGLAALDDWTWPRAHLARLQEALDLGLYPGLLPAAWVSHIQSQKGGPTRSRLPPFHLASGSAFENALLDELASLPHRALLGGKPGVVSMSALQPSASPLDVTVALEQAAQRDWTPKVDDLKKLGARGCDVIREAVYGGPLGEAYASSLEDFVRGASDSAMAHIDDDELEAPEPHGFETQKPIQPAQTVAAKAPSAYFDESGEPFDQDAFIGIDLIPLEVRKEAGMSTSSNAPSMRQSPQVVDSPRGMKRSRSLSIFNPPSKRQPVDDVSRSNDEGHQPGGAQPIWQDEETAAFMKGTILGQPLMDYVRDKYVSPLTHGQLATLWEISTQIKAGNGANDSTDMDVIFKHIDEQVPDFSVKQEDEGLMFDVDNTTSADLGHTERQEQEHLSRARNLAKLFLNRDYHRAKLQTYELIRAQGNAVDMNNVARNEADMKEALMIEQNLKPLQISSLPNPIADVDKALRKYAEAIHNLADCVADKGEVAEGQNELLESLRIAYVALGRHVPKLHLVPGQWSSWLDNAKTQLAKTMEEASPAKLPDAPMTSDTSTL